jgi:hypothetical protein
MDNQEASSFVTDIKIFSLTLSPLLYYMVSHPARREGHRPVTPIDGAGAVPAGGGSSLPSPGGPGIDPLGTTAETRGASLKRADLGGGNAFALHRVKRGLD